MRKHGWQLPYHPLQVVAVAVFLALGFSFYVFFAPFVGKRLFQYIVMGLYTPLIMCAFGLYIWCAAADPADPIVFKSKKYLNIPAKKKHSSLKESKLDGDSTSTVHDNAAAKGDEPVEKGLKNMNELEEREKKESSMQNSSFMALLAFLPCAFMFKFSKSQDESSEQQMSEDGMFYCSLCEVEVFKYSKHCRVCDKCIDHFDHHCRWLNNCIGKRNYRKFFTLMVSALLLLILQWSTGIVVLVCCFLDHKRYSVVIAFKLGSSFSVVPFVIVVVVCTILAMIATLPLAQLFFFHLLLIKKGISTYDYIIALREQEQQGTNGQQSPQMSPVSSLTGLSSASSFNTFQRGTWCTPPRLFLEDQFDVVHSDSRSVSSLGKKTVVEESTKRKNPTAVKISPWTLARLNAEQVSKVAAEARKKSKILQPVARREAPYGPAVDSIFGNNGRRMVPRPDSRRASKRVCLPVELPLESLAKKSNGAAGNSITDEKSTSLAPLQLEARSAFLTSQAISSSAGIIASSPDSSLDSPNIHPFHVSSSRAQETRQLTGLLHSGLDAQNGISLSRSSSDGYEPSGGEDSDRVERSTNWSNLLFRSDEDGRTTRLRASSSSNHHNRRP